MPGLALRKFWITLEPDAPWRLPPFHGATIRGGFGYAFRQVACALTRQECATCLLRTRCAYAYVFETPPPENAEMMRLYPAAPHPFVFDVGPAPGSDDDPRSPLEVGLVLAGLARPLLPYFVCAFQRLGERGLGRARTKFRVTAVDGVRAGAPPVSLFDPDREILAEFDDDIEIDFGGEGPECDALSLRIETPLRARFDGRLSRDLPFHVLARQLLRRTSAVLYFHGGVDPSFLDFRGLIERASAVRTESAELTWQELERFSTRQKQRMKMGGLVGTVRYRGDLGPFAALLRFGEVFHVGKGTSFGLGRYSIEGDGARVDSKRARGDHLDTEVNDGGNEA